MKNTQVVQNNNRIEIAEKGFLFLFMLYAVLTSCGFTFGKIVISMVMWPSFLLGAFLIGYRMVHYKQYITMSYFPLIVGMLASIGISTLINFQYHFKSNVIFCIYWALYLFVLYTIEQGASPEKIKRDFRFISLLFTAFISLLIVGGFFVFLIGYSKEITIKNEFTYYIGFAIGRLWGVFVNLNRGAISAALSSFLLAYFIATVKKRWFRILAGLMIVLNLLFVALSDSRSGAICFGLIAGFFTLFSLLFRFQNRKISFKLLAVLLAAVALITGYFLPRKMKTLYNQTTKIVYELSKDSHEEKDGEEKEEKELKLVERGYELSDDISNRRFDVWTSGLEIFSDSPKNIAFGTSFGGMLPYAETYLPDTYILSNNYDKIGTMDNDFFNLLVAQGILGVAVVVAFAIGILILIIKNFTRVNGENAFLLSLMLAAVFAIAGSSMFTSLIFFYFSQNAILFWTFLGLSVTVLTSGKGEKADDA